MAAQAADLTRVSRSQLIKLLIINNNNMMSGLLLLFWGHESKNLDRATEPAPSGTRSSPGRPQQGHGRAEPRRVPAVGALEPPAPRAADAGLRGPDPGPEQRRDYYKAAYDHGRGPVRAPHRD